MLPAADGATAAIAPRISQAPAPDYPPLEAVG